MHLDFPSEKDRYAGCTCLQVQKEAIMIKQDENRSLREGLETEGVQRFVGSNPTPGTLKWIHHWDKGKRDVVTR